MKTQNLGNPFIILELFRIIQSSVNMKFVGMASCIHQNALSLTLLNMAKNVNSAFGHR